jgi:hypothetical protein
MEDLDTLTWDCGSLDRDLVKVLVACIVAKFVAHGGELGTLLTKALIFFKLSDPPRLEELRPFPGESMTCAQQIGFLLTELATMLRKHNGIVASCGIYDPYDTITVVIVDQSGSNHVERGRFEDGRYVRLIAGAIASRECWCYKLDSRSPHS